MEKIVKITAIMLILAGIFACEIEKDNNTIVGTKWKVSGIVGVQTGVLTEIIRDSIDDCDICYTLVFDTDKDASGRSMYNSVSMKFPDPIQISSTNIPFSERPIAGGTKVGEPPKPTLYTKALENLTSYTYYNDELRLFCYDNMSYLLFKRIEQ